MNIVKLFLFRLYMKDEHDMTMTMKCANVALLVAVNFYDL